MSAETLNRFNPVDTPAEVAKLIPLQPGVDQEGYTAGTDDISDLLPPAPADDPLGPETDVLLQGIEASGKPAPPEYAAIIRKARTRGFLLRAVGPFLVDHANQPDSRTADSVGTYNEENSSDLASDAKERIENSMAAFMEAVVNTEIVEPPREARHTEVFARPISHEFGDASWRPQTVYAYGSNDPFQELNPELVAATSNMIGDAIVLADELRPTRDPALTYLTNNRSRGGKKMTVITSGIVAADAGLRDWVTHLPDAERLRPVAKPWSDEVTYAIENDEIVEIPQSPALQVLVGAAGDGRAVREREAWERNLVQEVVAGNAQTENNLVITSLGTGTGEPAMDTALAVMGDAYPHGSYSVMVNGFDVNPRSLAIARHIANSKNKGGELEFEPHMTNLLTREGIAEAVGGTRAKIVEAIGFAEYVPSDNAPTELERAQRVLMERRGCLSAQRFYGTIYEHMAEGSVLLTGNMRDDSPQAPFVIDGLGWSGIIQRSTEDYLRILKEAGIPGEAVRLYVPDPDKSAAVYNLVAITKLSV